jgi:hypothetical protein
MLGHDDYPDFRSRQGFAQSGLGIIGILGDPSGDARHSKPEHRVLVAYGEINHYRLSLYPAQDHKGGNKAEYYQTFCQGYENKSLAGDLRFFAYRAHCRRTHIAYGDAGSDSPQAESGRRGEKSVLLDLGLSLRHGRRLGASQRLSCLAHNLLTRVLIYALAKYISDRRQRQHNSQQNSKGSDAYRPRPERTFLAHMLLLSHDKPTRPAPNFIRRS